MYSEEDLQSAVAAGAISAEAAEALRAHVASAHNAPVVDEENFRLIASFNDVFVTIAAIMLLVALGGIGGTIGTGVAAALIAAASWGLAEFFTLKRRMALPSIVLLMSFVGGVIVALGSIVSELELDNSRLEAVLAALVFVVGVGAAWLHWRRFKVPITIAAGTASLVGVLFALIAAAIGPDSDVDFSNIFLPLAFVSGLAVFSFAMWWDMSDRKRETRRADVAFWLHLLAAPLIAHPVFYWIGVISGSEIGVSEAVAVLVVYLAMGLVALIVDRRALLVSALVYVLVAVTWLFDQFGAVELNVALTSLVIGSGLLCLSAFWTPIRGAVVGQLPAGLRERLPVLGVVPN